MTAEEFEAWVKYFDLVLPSLVGDGMHPADAVRHADEVAKAAAELVRERAGERGLPGGE